MRRNAVPLFCVHVPHVFGINVQHFLESGFADVAETADVAQNIRHLVCFVQFVLAVLQFLRLGVGEVLEIAFEQFPAFV